MDAPREEELLASKRFRVVRHHQIGADGREHIRDTVQHPGSVVILPLLQSAGGGESQVCLIRNQRIAVRQQLIELPAGTLDRDEDSLATARRELIEETGYRAEHIRPLGQLLMSPGILNERMHCYVATGLTPGPTELEAGEEIEPLVVPWSRALEMVRRGEIQDAKTVALLLFYDRFGDSA